jgi:hypothetical protein
MLQIFDAAERIAGGMSGSWILTDDGSAVGIVCLSGAVGDGDDEAAHREGGPNPRLTLIFLVGCCAKLSFLSLTAGERRMINCKSAYLRSPTIGGKKTSRAAFWRVLWMATSAMTALARSKPYWNGSMIPSRGMTARITYGTCDGAKWA